MSYPGGSAPVPAGQSQSAIIASPLGDALADALATSLRNLGWQVVVTDQFGPYAREARVCVVPLTPMTVNSAVVANVTANPPAPLIPLIVGATPLPPGRWATPPITFSGDPNRTAQDIVSMVAGGPSAAPGATPGAMPGAVPGIPGIPGMPGAPSGAYGQPPSGPAAMDPYAQPAPTPTFPPSQPYQQPPTAAMPYATGPSGYPPQPQPGYGQPGYPSQYQQGAPYAPYGQPPAPQAPKRAPRWPWIVGGVVLLLALLCGGGLFALFQIGKTAGNSLLGSAEATLTAQANATSEATATPNIPPNYTLYTDPAGAYSIAYPDSWTKSNTGGDLALADSNAAADMIIGTVDSNFAASDINSTENTFFTTIAGGGKVSNIKGPVTVVVGGATWTKKTADITRSGQTLHAAILVTNHGSKAFIIGYLATKNDFSNEETNFYQPMLGTFTFLQ